MIMCYFTDDINNNTRFIFYIQEANYMSDVYDKIILGGGYLRTLCSNVHR